MVLIIVMHLDHSREMSITLSSFLGSDRLNVIEMRQVLESFMENCPNMYTMCVFSGFIGLFHFMFHVSC